MSADQVGALLCGLGVAGFVAAWLLIDRRLEYTLIAIPAMPLIAVGWGLMTYPLAGVIVAAIAGVPWLRLTIEVTVIVTRLLMDNKRKYQAAGGPVDPLALQAHIDALRAREEEG